LRSVLSENSTVTRLRPKVEVDEIEATPETRGDRALDDGRQFAVDRFGRGAGKPVVTVITGRSTSGSSRISAP
jgi:hypothetical protein